MNHSVDGCMSHAAARLAEELVPGSQEVYDAVAPELGHDYFGAGRGVLEAAVLRALFKHPEAGEQEFAKLIYKILPEEALFECCVVDKDLVFYVRQPDGYWAGPTKKPVGAFEALDRVRRVMRHFKCIMCDPEKQSLPVRSPWRSTPSRWTTPSSATCST
eukprot:scaffold471963_cov17-Prasinocladus_malaysianus.AAC.1